MGHNGYDGTATPAGPVTIIDGSQLYARVSAMADTLVRTETLLASHLEAEREAREARAAERDAADARFAALERRVWAVPGAGTLIALAALAVTVMSIKGG